MSVISIKLFNKIQLYVMLTLSILKKGCVSMRKVNLRMFEQNKYNVIKRVVNKEINIHRASITLNLSIRTIYRLVAIYNEKGKEGFIHGNRDRKPAISIPNETKDQILDLYKGKYYGSNFKHFQELLKRNNNIDISYFALYELLKNNSIVSPKAQRHTIKEYNKSIKEKQKNSIKLSDTELVYLSETNLDDNQNYHPRKSRKKYYGELIQMDACEDYWFGDSKTHLHAAIDDASGRILALYFDHEETLKGYYHLFHDILTTEGIPVEFLTDNRTVFNYERHKHPKQENDTLTQFSYACHRLGTMVTTTSIPQVKGRVERLFNTLLSRLRIELRIAGITDIVKANEFLPGFIESYNEQFAIQTDYIKSVFEKQIDENKINYTLSIIAPRIIDNGSTIKYKNKIYAFYNDGKLVGVTPKTKCMVMETYNGELVCAVGETIYDLYEFKRNKEYSINFDTDIIKQEKEKRPYKPSPNHPWGYKAYVNKLRRYYAQINA